MTATTSRPRLHMEPLEDRYTPATLSVADVTVTEGVAGTQTAAVRVILSEPLQKPVTVNYGTGNGSAIAGSDYAATAGTVSFAKNETSKTILVPVYGDRLPEDNETFSVRLTGAKGATIADGVGTVAILDGSPRLSLSNVVGSEGGVITFTVTLSAAFDTAFTVDFATLDGSPVDQPAYAGQDYVATSGTLTFAPGETTKTITVQILDNDPEEYDEYFFVQLSNPTAPVFITGDAWGTILGEFGSPYVG